MPIGKMPLNVSYLESVIKKHALHKNPARYARQILICLGRLIERNPSLGTLKFEAVEDKRVHLLPECDRPAKLCQELEEWKRATPVVLHGVPNASNALAPRTIEDYATAYFTVVTIFHSIYGRLSHDIGIEFLCKKTVVAPWLHALFKRQEPSTIRTTVAGVLRIARDRGVNQESISFLEARLADYMKRGSGTDTERLAKLAEAGKFVALIDAPGKLMLQAEDPGRRSVSRLAAAAAPSR